MDTRIIENDGQTKSVSFILKHSNIQTTLQSLLLEHEEDNEHTCSSYAATQISNSLTYLLMSVTVRLIYIKFSNSTFYVQVLGLNINYEGSMVDEHKL